MPGSIPFLTTTWQRTTGENEEPFNAFSTNFGLGYYDDDFADTNAAEQGSVAVESLISQCSFSSSYSQEALAEARRRAMAQSEFVFHLYDFEYQPAVTRVTRSPFFEFPGSFAHSPEASSAIPYGAE